MGMSHGTSPAMGARRKPVRAGFYVVGVLLVLWCIARVLREPQ